MAIYSKRARTCTFHMYISKMVRWRTNARFGQIVAANRSERRWTRWRKIEHTVARSQMRNFSSVSLLSARELHGGVGGCKGKPLCERAESRADEGEEGSRRLGKPRISWTVPVDAPFVSDRLLPPPPRHRTPPIGPRRVGSIAATNNASPDLHDWIGVAKLKLLPATDVPSLYRHANAGN